MTVPAPVGLGRDTARRARSRAALVEVLWDRAGERRLPTERALVSAMAACDPRDIWWVCEANSAGPVFLLPTREWIDALARVVDESGARTVLEVAAGDGFLSRCLKRTRPRLRVIATDNHAWMRAASRMSATDRRDYRAVPFAGIRADGDVQRMAVTTAVARFRPDLVLVSWAPPGTLVERAIRGSCLHVLDIGVDGDVCGNGARTWRFEKEFLEGPIEERALCRLDEDPRGPRRTRVTLYYGRRHRQFVEPSVRHRRDGAIAFVVNAPRARAK